MPLFYNLLRSCTLVDKLNKRKCKHTRRRYKLVYLLVKAILLILSGRITTMDCMSYIASQSSNGVCIRSMTELLHAITLVVLH